MLGETILIAIFAGLFAGWIVHLISQGSGLPLTGSVTVGAVGAIAGQLLIPLTGLNLGHATVAVALNGGLGALLLLLVFKLVRPDDDRAPIKQDGGKP